jgi:hypothetical protein
MPFNMTLSKLSGPDSVVVAPVLLAFGWAAYLSFLLGTQVVYLTYLTQKMVHHLGEFQWTRLMASLGAGG